VDRRDANLVDSLWNASYFTKDAKVGILVYDDPVTKESVTKSMVPALARHGLQPAVQIVYPDPVNSPWSNYVLQMQAAGVTHVLWGGSYGGFWPPVLMMQAAENQRYRPIWGAASDQKL